MVLAWGKACQCVADHAASRFIPRSRNVRSGFLRGVLQVDVAQKRAVHRCFSCFAEPVEDTSPTLPTTSLSGFRRMRPAALPEGLTLRLRIHRLASVGHGVGRHDETGRTIFVFGALPGESVEVRIGQNFKDYSQGLLIRVLEVADQRVEPRCELFGRCGGCQYQHLEYEAQLRWKHHHVVDALRRNIKSELPINLVRQTRASPLQYGYRTKITPHLQMPPISQSAQLRRSRRCESWVERASVRNGGGADGKGWGDLADGPLGFLEEVARNRDEGGHWWKSVIDAPQCPVATEAINVAMTAARAYVRKNRGPFEVVLRHTAHDGVVMDRKRVVTETIAGFGSFSFRAGGFFQNNSALLPDLIRHVIEAAMGKWSDGSSGGPTHLVDAYCGVGIFAVAGGPHFQKVIGIEADEAAVELAQSNANLRGASIQASFIAAQVEDGLQTAAQEVPSDQTTLIVDPPRAGLSKDALSAVIALYPRRLVYVSCDCKTLARDLSQIVGAGYTMRDVTPFDLFPQSRHIEVVAILDRAMQT